MLKSNLRDMPVITIHFYPSDKKSLMDKASEKGMGVSTYCRMLLLESLKVKE